MKFINCEIIEDNKQDIQSFYRQNILDLFPNIDNILEGGLIDKLIKLLVDYELDMQEKIKWLYSQFSPTGVENFLQDALYERIGVLRLNAAPMIVKLRLVSNPGISLRAESLRIKNTYDNSEFKNSSDILFDSEGYTEADFFSDSVTAETPELSFKVFRSPVSLRIDEDYPVSIISMGHPIESDIGYKERYNNSKAIKACVTPGGNISNLSKHLDSLSYINILTKNSNPEMDFGTVRIIVKHNTSDEIFAREIFETFGVGIKFLGDTCVELLDSCGYPVNIRFDKAKEIPVSIYIYLNFVRDVSFEQGVEQVKNALIGYVSSNIFGLGVNLYATDLANPILKCQEVALLKRIKLNSGDSNDLVDNISFAVDEIPIFQFEYIYVEEEVNGGI